MTRITERNKVAQMFNLETLRQAIANCPKEEVVILCGHWSINHPSQDLEDEMDNLFELENELNCSIQVTDYDDLVADIHGILD